MKRILGVFLALLFMAGADSAFAVTVPTIHQVYTAAHSGHLLQAQQMMNQVLAVHPDSGKAHFVMAEILAAEHQFTHASQELGTAQQLAPGLPFEKPQSVQSLQARIQAGLTGAYSTRPLAGRGTAAGNGVVIALFIACLVLLAVVVWAMRRSRPMPATYPGAISPMNMPGNLNPLNTGYTPTAPYGGGFMSNLKTGLGIGAGMAAGEALVNHFIDGRGNPGVGPVMPDQSAAPMDEAMAGSDLGGNDFGMSDDSSWSDNDMGSSDFSGMDSGGDDWN